MQSLFAAATRAAVLAILVSSAAAAVAQEQPTRFDPARDAARDVATAVALAKTQGKHVLVDVGGEWCVWCHIMDRFFETDAEARALRDAHYVWVKVNWSKENTNAALLARWPKVAGYPHLFVLDARGRLLHSQDTSELEEGKGYSATRVRAFLLRWAPVTRKAGNASSGCSVRSAASVVQLSRRSLG